MRRLGVFFSLTVAWSYTVWITLIPSVQNNLNLSLSLDWAYVGLMAPGLFAILLTSLEKGVKGLKELLTPLLRIRVPLFYYSICYLGVFAFYCLASFIAIQLKGPLPNSLGKIFHPSTLLILAKLTLIYTFCEEIGWRGYALVRLSKYVSPLFSTLLVGFMWGIWLIPLTYLYNSSFTLFTFFLFTLHIFSLSIIFAWLYFKTGKSLLLVGLLHGSMNTLGMFFPLLLSPVGQSLNYEAVLMEVIVAIFMVPYLGDVRYPSSSRTRSRRSKNF